MKLLKTDMRWTHVSFVEAIGILIRILFADGSLLTQLIYTLAHVSGKAPVNP